MKGWKMEGRRGRVEGGVASEVLCGWGRERGRGGGGAEGRAYVSELRTQGPSPVAQVCMSGAAQCWRRHLRYYEAWRLRSLQAVRWTVLHGARTGTRTTHLVESPVSCSCQHALMIL